MKVETALQKVKDYLKVNKQATAHQMAKALKLSTTAIRNALSFQKFFKRSGWKAPFTWSLMDAEAADPQELPEAQVSEPGS